MKKNLGYLFVGIMASFMIMPTAVLAEDEVNNSENTSESQSIEQSTEKVIESTEVQSSDMISSSTENESAEKRATTDTTDTIELRSEQPKLEYSIYNKKIGWQVGQENGGSSSFSNDKIEAFKVGIDGIEASLGSIQYRAHVSDIGWQSYVSANEISGVSGKRLEAIQIQLTGTLKANYDIYYRVKVQNFGWLDWAVNGRSAGTTAFSYQIEGIQIQLKEKGQAAPGATKRPAVQYKQPNIKYQSHIKNIGWQASKSNGQTSGTIGQNKRLEALKIAVDNAPVAGGIEYRSHVQDIGWQNYVSNNSITGTVGKQKQVEALSIRLTGELAKHFEVYYRVHAKNFGWLDWASNGQNAGTAGFSYQLESIEMKLVRKGANVSGAKKRYFIPFKQPTISYQSHVQDLGWQASKKNGQTSGTVGKSKRVEAIKINIDNAPVSGGIQYRSHVQDYGWQNYVSSNQLSGTVGKAKRVEAFDIRLTGELSKHFNVYYRTHAEYFGWLGWNKNGGISGTSGYGFRLEGLDIVLVKKESKGPVVSNNYKQAPGDIKNYYMNAPKRIELKTRYYYTDRSLRRGNDIAAGTVINVKRRVLDKNGYPILETPYGYVTAGKNIVTATNKGQKTFMDVPYYNQMTMGYPNGCEEFSLYMALEYLGATHGQNVHQVTNAVPKVPSWGNPHEGFNGNPTDRYGFHTIYPRAFTPYAKRYAPNSRDISGVDTGQFKEELMKGNPIVVWGTYPYLAAPRIDGTYYGSLKVANLHVWLVTGFDGNSFHVTDPIYGTMWVSEGTLALSYSPNKMAVSIDK
ncbi:C39 family peptidase [Enterococcus plantarum]|uniref:C39 family peptidase n=1 Tax=Enterococcus plantarum TaxID=1077675 RepID=UPI001A90A578|nr:C39 family peptidase [Enterococcus plantarum]MBO0468650.1 C39 family peptidase [Enterococcus plantarum]